MPKEEVADLEFERVHRIPTRRSQNYNPKKPKPIIRQGPIFQYVKNIDRNTKLGVADDFPKQREKIRKKFLPDLKDANVWNA